MKKWNIKLILLLALALVLSISVLGGCGQKYDFAQNKAPNGVKQEFYNDMLAVINDTIELKEKFDEGFSIYDDDNAWYKDLYEHETLEKYKEDDPSLSGSESMLLHRVDALYMDVLFFHLEMGTDMGEKLAEGNIEIVNTQIEKLKEVIDVDISEKDFIE